MSSARTARLSSWEQEDAAWQDVLLGSRPAFMQLLGLSLRPMLNYYSQAIPSQLRDRIDPYDLRQAACLRIVAGYEDFHPTTLAAFHAWHKRIEYCVLARALRRCGANAEGSAQRPHQLNERAVETGRQRPFAPGARSTLDTMVIAETAIGLQAAVDQLSDTDRQILLWHARDGISFAEIARRLHIARGHAWRRYRQIRQRLSRRTSASRDGTHRTRRRSTPRVPA